MATGDEEVERWSPRAAPRVVGTYTRRVWNGVSFDPQRINIRCEVCGERWEGVCDSGRVRDRIAKWSVLHRHVESGGAPTS